MNIKKPIEAHRQMDRQINNIHSPTNVTSIKTYKLNKSESKIVSFFLQFLSVVKK